MKSGTYENEELNAIIESVSDGIYVTDGEGNTLRINSAFERITGIRSEEVLGKNVRDLLRDKVYAKSVSLLVFEERKPVSIIEKLPNGQEALLTGTPIFDDENNIFRVVTTLRDLAKLNTLKRKLARSHEMSKRYKQELLNLRLQQLNIDNVVIYSQQMKEIMRLAIQLGDVDSTVLITGESGTGKEIVAKTIHRAGRKEFGPLITANCCAIPESLIESELFGYESGAFTGAQRAGKPGLFEVADGGTIFLDEIGDLTRKLQVKLLRVLQEKEITRIGGRRPVKINVRIIAATNRNIKEMVDRGKFREDLYYRLNVVPVHISPLRERRECIIPLINHFLDHFNRRFKKDVGITPEAIGTLEKYPWPGNVRELENTIERLVVLSNGGIIDRESIPNQIMDEADLKTASKIRIPEIMSLDHAKEEVEKQLIGAACKKYPSTRKAAKALGISQSTVVRKMKYYGLTWENRDKTIHF